MLRQLTIRNLAVINDVSIDFKEHFSVLIGETGAGKSIIIDALSLITKERANSEIVGSKGNKACIEGVFQVDASFRKQLEETLGFFDEELLIIQREIDISGRSLIRLNGRIVTLSLVKQITDKIIDIHSQHENQYLLNPSNHLSLIDEFARIELANAKAIYQKCFDNYQTLLNRKKEIDNFEFTKYEINELKAELDVIVKLNLKENEIEELYEQSKNIASYYEISQAVETIISLLDDEGSALSKIYDSGKEIEKLKELAQFVPFKERISEVYYQLEDIVSEIRNIYGSINYDENALNYINERLFQIGKLQRKYGNSYQKIEERKKKLEEQISLIENQSYELEKIQQKIVIAEKETTEQGLILREIRKKAGNKLCSLIIKEAEDLCLQNTQFEVEFNDIALTKTGIDEVEFLLSLNKGQQLRPLSRIISGGELSRIMLSLKIIFAELYGTRTIIFDEIDSGVSGRVASAIANKLTLLSSKLQVLSVTHLPQVAARADNFYYVSKLSTANGTETQVRELGEEEKIQVIAKMLSDEEDLESAKTLARELVKSK